MQIRCFCFHKLVPEKLLHTVYTNKFQPRKKIKKKIKIWVYFLSCSHNVAELLFNQLNRLVISLFPFEVRDHDQLVEAEDIG
jgi:hypothetical protein